ncbi:MAG: aminotransferase class V-fold PLP-dependent enzyme [Bacillota bacterium]
MTHRAMRTVGMDQPVPVLGGEMWRYVNLDNGASTPPLVEVQEALERFLPWYSSVHRGAGLKSQVATERLEAARLTVLRFVGANPATHTALFGANTTEAINRLAALYPFEPGDVVLLTGMEHHANDLPWRARTEVSYVAVSDRGELDLNDLEAKLKRYQGRVRLLSVSGASNVTGFVNPIHTIARLAHAHGAQIVVDAAQLAPHRPIAMAQANPAEAIDFLALSGHKLYAPYGGGALIAPLDFVNTAVPDRWGGGAVTVVGHGELHLTTGPDRLEPGSPNTLGVIALAAAMETLMAQSMEQVDAHERHLTTYALERLRQVEGIQLYGSDDPARTADRVGVIPFNLGDLPHGLVAAILAQEWGIGVRSGCFCAHPYVTHLLGVRGEAYEQFRDRALAGDRADIPGMVRVSFGCYTTEAEVDLLVEALHRIARGEYRQGYRLDPATGEYSHPDYAALTHRFLHGKPPSHA